MEKKSSKTKILPFFDNIEYLHSNADHVVLPDPNSQNDFLHTLSFLKSYSGSLGTFNSYRREVERLLQWSWHIQHKSITALKRDEVESYIRFCQNPPETWISLKKTPRFILQEGLRVPNPEWKPFVATVSKSAKKRNIEASIHRFTLSQGSLREIFAILSTFYNFLIAEEYTEYNPVMHIRQKSKFLQQRPQKSPVRRLSLLQWETILEACDMLAQDNAALHERTRFMLCLLFGMYLRISELAASPRWVPMMYHFSKDSYGHWWFTTVGKGNKERQIAVSDDMLKALTRYRLYLGLTPLPTTADTTPLIPKVRGNGPMSDTAPIRRIIQRCFDRAEGLLQQRGQQEEADTLMSATVHWLRHTGISEDVKHRPREHVRDDAGHASSMTTDRYIDIEMHERHNTARNKKIAAIDSLPQEEH